MILNAKSIGNKTEEINFDIMEAHTELPPDIVAVSKFITTTVMNDSSQYHTQIGTEDLAYQIIGGEKWDFPYMIFMPPITDAQLTHDHYPGKHVFYISPGKIMTTNDIWYPVILNPSTPDSISVRIPSELLGPSLLWIGDFCNVHKDLFRTRLTLIESNIKNGTTEYQEIRYETFNYYNTMYWNMCYFIKEGNFNDEMYSLRAGALGCPIKIGCLEIPDVERLRILSNLPPTIIEETETPITDEE